MPPVNAQPTIIYSSGRKQIAVSHAHLGILSAHVVTRTHKIEDINPHSLVFGERHLQFQARTDHDISKAVKSLVMGALPRVGKSTQLLAQLTGSDLRQLVLLPFFRNTARSEEIFYPIKLNENLGVYVYPWIPTNTEIQPTAQIKFNKFVTAGCLFGSSIWGVDQETNHVPLIKHDHQWKGDQIIHEIVSTQDSLYEVMQFNQINAIAQLINKFSNNTPLPELDYHLPTFDYVLHGIKLFLNNKITREALEDFFYLIAERKEQHIKKINEICAAHNVKVNIESPFDNVFAVKGESQEDFVNSIYEAFPFLKENVATPTEKDFVGLCLEKLCSENPHVQPNKPKNKNHIQLWNAYSKAADFKADDIEDLFKLANPIMIGSATVGKQSFQVCSMLPASEKQIQVEYQNLNKKTNQSLPPAFNITLLDTLPAYSASNKFNGVTFYSSDPDLDRCISEIEEHLIAAQKRAAELATLIPLETFSQGFTAVKARQNLILTSSAASASTASASTTPTSDETLSTSPPSPQVIRMQPSNGLSALFS